MKKFTQKTVSLALSAAILLTAMSGCNTDNGGTNSENTSDSLSQAAAPNTEQQTESRPAPQNPAQTTEAPAKSKSGKLVIFDKEYDDVYDFFDDEDLGLRAKTFQIAKYYLQGDKENLKQYFEKEEDWEKSMNNIFEEDHFKDLYFFMFDHHFISPGYDGQGRKTISLNFNYIYGGYYNEEGEYLQITDRYQYIYISLVRTDSGEWLATSVGRE